MEFIGLAASAVPSSSSPSSSASDVTLEAIMAHLQCMDVYLDALSNELCQVNTYVSRIARRQARLGGFTASPSPSLEASIDKDGDYVDASSSSDIEKTTSQ